MPRLHLPSVAEMTPEQRDVHDEVVSGVRVGGDEEALVVWLGAEDGDFHRGSIAGECRVPSAELSGANSGGLATRRGIPHSAPAASLAACRRATCHM